MGLSGYGGRRDWEIFNRPNYGGNLPFTFPLIYAKEQGRAPVDEFGSITLPYLIRLVPGKPLTVTA